MHLPPVLPDKEKYQHKLITMHIAHHASPRFDIPFYAQAANTDNGIAGWASSRTGQKLAGPENFEKKRARAGPKRQRAGTKNFGPCRALVPTRVYCALFTHCCIQRTNAFAAVRGDMAMSNHSGCLSLFHTFRIHSLFKALVKSTGLACLSPLPCHLTLTACWTHVLYMPCALAHHTQYCALCMYKP